MMDLKERIAHVIKIKNITATQLAEEMNIQRSGLSHILSGRNNPSLDFVTKLKETYPEFSLDWLLLGNGSVTISPESSNKPKQPLLFELDIDEAATPADKPVKKVDLPTEKMDNEVRRMDKESSYQDKKETSDIVSESRKNEETSLRQEERFQKNTDSKLINRVIILYEDHTFSIFENNEN
ncbi:MAG: hypothetical protein CVT92_06655 [Bacteroidetes bacterium HGW-Bacteroidetes-1]|jgi:transcriptional regulator with XRE-family HTH domain|nr:MAG: hypothetical protein CVT92_06655 [Bacteroidetes bacterium HGW-Bacteroidetes-1]